MKNARRISQNKAGFSLAEVIASVTIGAMVLVTMLSIYRQAQTSAAAVERKIESSRLASEVLQRIAEDLDRMVGNGSDTKIIVQNKFEEGYPTRRP
ncbi:MAG: PulJ/GspJ family protein [Planctomycetota bacterium]|jgi:type II secretory pathway component PulJ